MSLRYCAFQDISGKKNFFFRFFFFLPHPTPEKMRFDFPHVKSVSFSNFWHKQNLNQKTFRRQQNFNFFFSKK